VTREDSHRGDRVTALWHGVCWYLRELTGEADYGRYVARLASEHPGVEPATRREFERARVDRTAAGPGSRCC
jgi:uncharacterized short protein YbdD (DUF466 family)